MIVSKFFIIVLCVCLAVSLFLNGYLYYESSNSGSLPLNHSTFFSFVFSPAMQNITTGNLYLNLTFDSVEGNLTVKAEVNAESFNPEAFLALQFDSDNNGTIDVLPWHWIDDGDLMFLLRASNKTIPSISPLWNWYADGVVDFFYRMHRCEFPEETGFHYCTYDEARKLYSFYFTFPTTPRNMTIFSTHKGIYGIEGRLVRVAYGLDTEHYMPSTVYVPPFSFVE